MGIEMELAFLLIMQLIATAVFSKFEGETKAYKKILKWGVFDGITVLLYFYFRHYALLFPLFALIPGAIVHITWCRKNGIHPINATPRKKYYALRQWKYED